MKNSNTLTLICLVTALTLLPFKLSLANDSHSTDDHATEEHATEEHATEEHSPEDLPVVTGEIKRVKPKSGKITIKHEPIPNLDMPGMTMVFRTDEGTDISAFKKGDNVEFTVIEKDGKMYIVEISSAE